MKKGARTSAGLVNESLRGDDSCVVPRRRDAYFTFFSVISVVSVVFCTVGCGDTQNGRDAVAVPGRAGVLKSAASVRALRRAYDGAPPVIPHGHLGSACMNCHNETGVELPGVGFSPPMPHDTTAGMSAHTRCTQCHVTRETETLFRQSTFAGLRQDLRKGRRLHSLAPPVLPHPVFMRENCRACHTGAAAREEIRCSHPERVRCVQCHVPRTTPAEFQRESP